jgi:hypothetical protein
MPLHTVAQSDSDCESGSVVVHLCRDGCNTKGLHQGQATLIPSRAVISEIVTMQFPRIIA